MPNSAGAQLIEWGIATHQGQEYGAINRWIMLTGCLSILLLSITAPVLWWNRKSQGSTVLPPTLADRKRGRPALFATAALAVLYPLTGTTILFVGLLDWAFRKQTTTGS